jgi:quercetin dioxygenase-like cupin family protein
VGAGARRHCAQGILRQRHHLALHKLMPKHEPKPHKHAYEQIVYILAGHIRFHVGEVTVLLGPGGLLQIPPDVMHWGEVVGDEPVLNLDVFTPVREEYAPAPEGITAPGQPPPAMQSLSFELRPRENCGLPDDEAYFGMNGAYTWPRQQVSAN